MYIDKEAAVTEVMREVSLADLGGRIGTLAYSLGCFGAFATMVAVGDGLAGSAGWGLGFKVPNIVWVSLVVGFAVAITTSNRSYQEIKWSFWFPRLGFFGWFFMTIYITGIYQIFVVAYGLPEGTFERYSLSAVGFIVVTIPGLFFDLCQVGHVRLIQKREQAAGEP